MQTIFYILEKQVKTQFRYCYEPVSYILCLLSIAFITSIGQIAPSLAQCTRTTEGREFWLGFADARDGTDEQLSITVTSRVGATVSIFGGTGSTLLATFLVGAGGSTTTIVTEAWENETTEVIENKGIRVECSDLCNVYALSYQRNSADATLIYPTPSLGDEYYIMTYAQATALTNTQVRNSEFLIVATQDGTNVTITPNKITTALKPANVPFTITLNKGQSYQVKSGEFSGAGSALPAGQGDLTGSKVTSTKPIAVFGANIATVVPNINTCCWDHLYEQMAPISVWGKKFITVPYKTRLWDVFRVLARIDGTVVSIGGTAVATLNEGQFYEFDTNGSNVPKQITATNPVMVMQFSTSTNADAVGNADPFMINLSPIEQTVEDITFVAFTSSVITAYYLNILTETTNVSNMRYDGAPIAPISFVAIPGTIYSRAQLDIVAGTHRLTNNGSGIGFSANIYGYGPFESYGYAAGVNLTPQLNFLFGTASVDNDVEDFCDSEGAQTFIAEYSVPGSTLSYSWKNMTTGLVVSTTDALLANNFSATTDYELSINDLTGGCSIKDTLRVIFYKVPTASISQGDSTKNTYRFCLADSAKRFTATHPDNAGLVVQHYWLDVASGDTLGNGLTQTLPALLGSFQYILHTYNTADTSKVCFDADTITVVYNQGLPVDIRHLGVIKDTVVFCDDDGAQTLSAADPSHISVSYQWRDLTRDVDLGTAVTQTANIFGANTLYEVEVTNLLTGCTSKDSIFVVFFAANVRSGGSASDVFRFCDDDGPRTLNAFDPLNGPSVVYQWKDLGTGAVVSSTSVLTAANFSDTTVYEIFLRDTISTCEARDTIMVIFRPTPAAEIRLNGVSMSSYVLCSGSGSLRLNGFSASNKHVRYQWRKDGAIISSDTAITVTDAFFGTFTYQLTVTDTISNCVATDNITISAYPRLTGRTSGTANICAGKTTPVTFTLAGTFPMTLTYTIRNPITGVIVATNTISGITASPVVINVSDSGIYKITTLTSAVGCSAAIADLTDSARIRVIPIPNVALTSNDFDNKICRNQPIKFTATGAAYYKFFINGVLMQEGTAATFTPTTGILNTGDLVWATGINPPTDCKDTSNVITMTVNRIPVTSIGVSPREICPGGDTLKLTSTLTGPTGSFIYDWRKVSGTTAIPVGTGAATLSVTDTGRYFLIITENLVTGCQYRTDTIKVNFKAPPVLNVRDTVVCMNDRPAILVAQDLTHGTAITYQWFNTATPTTVIGTNGTLAVSVAGLYRVVIKDTTTGCTRTDLARVTFNPNPDFEIKGHDKPLCEGRDTLTLDASNLDSMQIVWIGAGLLPLGTDNRSRIVTQSGVVTVIVTDTSKASLCRTVKYIDVKINDIPLIEPALKDYKICEDTISIRLNALHPTHASNATYAWRNLKTGEVVGTEGFLNLSFENDYAETLYEVLVTHPNSGCSRRDTAAVTFQKKSNAEISIENGQLALCIGEKVQLRGTGGTSYRWSTGETTELITFEGKAPGFYAIVLSADFATTCGQSKDTVEIQVKPKPLALIADTLITACQNTPIVLNGANFSHDFSTLYTWTNLESNAILGTEAKLTLVFDSLTTPSFDRFRVGLSVQDSLTNCLAMDTVVIDFEPSSAVEIDSNALTEVCLNDTIVLQAKGAARYLWNTGDTTAQIRIKATKPGFMTFIVQANAANLCASTMDTLFVRVRPLPTIQLSAVNQMDSIKICADDSITLLPRGGLSYEWGHDPLARDTIRVSPKKSMTYYVIGTDKFGCKNTDSLYVEVSPTVDLGPNQVACMGDTLTLGQISTDTTATYKWLPTGQTTALIQVTKSGKYIVKVKTAECSYERNVSVSFKAQPKIEYVKDTVFCFEAFPNQGQIIEHELKFKLLNPDTAAQYIYVWTDSTGQIVGNEPVLKIRKGGRYSLKIMAKYSVTCDTDLQMNVDEACPARIFVPTAFTPNDDGLNDHFEVFGANIKFFEMMIFNRWNQVVYYKSTQDFRNLKKEDFWNGTYKGSPLEDGNFVYIIKYQAEGEREPVKKVHGALTLLR